MAVPDPGGNFASDAHRRVLGHLSHPDDAYGWSLAALRARMGVVAASLDDSALQQILDELAVDGHAESLDGAWRLTVRGHDTLAGSIANEPPPGAEVVGPAMVGLRPTPIARPESTPIGGSDASPA